MSRKIIISKYRGNTDYSIIVIDSYGTEHHLGYCKSYIIDDVERKAEIIWENEVEPKKDLMGDAIAECIQMDIDRGVEPNLD